MVRLVQDAQLQFGQVDISQIQLDSKSRDDIPQILRGLQHVYSDRETREKIFALLKEKITHAVNINEPEFAKNSEEQTGKTKKMVM